MVSAAAFIFCAAAALAAGFIDAIAGGGGLLTVPALMVSGLPPHTVLGINKVSASMGTTVSLINYSLHGLVHWRLVLYGLGFSIFGSWAGAALTLYLSSELLAKILIFLLPVGMLATFVPSRAENAPGRKITGVKLWLYLPLICLALGVYDGFFGPGTGSFLILALHWILKMSLIDASGTTKAINLGSNISGAASFIWHGAIYWPLGLVMGVCLMLGNWVGSAFAIRVGAKAVRRFLFISLFLLLTTLVWQNFAGK